MHRYQQKALDLYRRYGEEAFPETVTWTHLEEELQTGKTITVERTFTVRCNIRALSDYSTLQAQAIRQIPGFEQGDATLKVHPDDARGVEGWPPVGSFCNHPRFGRLELTAIGPEKFWSMRRMGALTWMK